MKKLLLLISSLFVAGVANAVNPIYGTVRITTTTTMTPPLQTGTIDISSATILNLRVSTATITNLTVSTLTITNTETDANLVVSTLTVTSSGTIANLRAPISTIDALTIGTSFNGGGFKLTSISTPTSSTDAATKGYVDILANGSTNYIQNTSTLQSATLNVSSGTIVNFTATASTTTRINATTIVVSTLTPTNIVGTTTNDNAAVGNYGQYVSTFIADTAGTPATGTGQYFDIASMPLTAGDWDVTAQPSMIASGATVTAFIGGVSVTSGNSATGLVFGDNFLDGSVPVNATFEQTRTIAAWRLSIASPTTVYLKGFAAYSVSTPKGYGRMSARRVR